MQSKSKCASARRQPQPSNLAAALDLRGLKFWVVAIYPKGAETGSGIISKGKNPIGLAWGRDRWDEDKLRRTFGKYPQAGVGITFGPGRAPNGQWLIDLEGDGPGAPRSLSFLGVDDPITPSWDSRRGAHTLFWVSEADGMRLLDLLKLAGASESKEPGQTGVYKLEALPDLEWRIGGYTADNKVNPVVKQVQSVVPPTEGEDGVPRAWKDGPDTPVAELPAGVFAALDGLIETREQAAAIQAEANTPAKPKQNVNGFRIPVTGSDPTDAYLRKTIADVAGEVARAAPGNRHNAIRDQAVNLAGVVRQFGEPYVSSARAALLEADRLNGHARDDGPGDGEECVRSAFEEMNPTPRNLDHVGKDSRSLQHEGNGQHRDIDVELAGVLCTDIGNGHRMATRFGHSLRFCHPWGKWLHYDGRRWKADDTASARRLAKATVKKMHAEAAKIEDEDRRKRHAKWAIDSEASKRVNAMMTECAAELEIAVLPADMDRDPMLLNVLNGTIDLRTGRLRPHDRKDLVSCLAPVKYDPRATCPTWDKVLNKVFAADVELIGFVRRLFGLCLTGDVSEQVLPIFYGVGANGKTTLLGVLLEILGEDYAMTAPPGFLVIRQGEQHPTERAMLHKMRLIVDMESAEGARLNENWVKQLTGSDQITARRMREDFWKFSPTHKIIMGTNHRPEIRETKNAIWRRVKLVPFAVSIPEQEQDKDLPKKLRGEYPGILAWAVRGCGEWLQGGLKPPKSIVKATEDYRNEQDLVGEFLKAECTIDGTLKAKASLLFERFQRWEGSVGVTQRAFGRAMTERGFQRIANNGTWYEGLGLRSEGTAPY